MLRSTVTRQRRNGNHAVGEAARTRKCVSITRINLGARNHFPDFDYGLLLWPVVPLRRCCLELTLLVVYFVLDVGASDFLARLTGISTTSSIE